MFHSFSCLDSNKSWFSGRVWGQQLFSFQSPQWMARTSSLNCNSCANPYQDPDSLNCLRPFHWKTHFVTEKCFVASPSQKSALIKIEQNKNTANGNTASENLVVCFLVCWENSAHGVSKNMVGNCVLIFFKMDFCPRSIFTCSVTVWGVLVCLDVKIWIFSGLFQKSPFVPQPFAILSL